MSKNSESPPLYDVLPIAVRAYNQPQKEAYFSSDKDHAAGVSSEWAIVFDTETTADQAQSLRIGTYQVRRFGGVYKQGIFTEPSALTPREMSLIRNYANLNNLTLLTKSEFVETIIFDIGYELGAMIIGFNLPFDLSRLAIAHASARRRMYGGFSFKLSPYSFRPRIRIKHLTKRAAIIDFSKPDEQKTPRSMRKKMDYVPPNRGFFLDLKTISAALTSRSHSLKSLAQHLCTVHQKAVAEEHGAPIDEDYLNYAMIDTQVTWECYERLCALYATHELHQKPIEDIYSEAGIGKAYLSEMGIKPWRVVQPNFPPDMLGIIMSTFYGGRAEVRLRRMVALTIHCDFLSMYPTICSLMGLWKWVIATGVDYSESTEETQDFLDRVTLPDIRDPALWKNLNVIVQIQVDDDIFPIRSQYPKADGLTEGETQFTTGLNKFKCKPPMWFAIADCISSKILTGKTVKVLKAYTFIPQGAQPNLRPVNIAGDPAYSVDPLQDDFYKRLIDMRIAMKAQILDGIVEKNQNLKTAEGAVKILASSTSYGIFVEVNVQELCKAQKTNYHTFDGSVHSATTNQLEEPGKFFHPLIGAFITAGARLMLALAEHLASQNNLGWILCDTDSMAFTPLEGMTAIEFSRHVENIRSWFAPLNPYDADTDLLKLEKINFTVDKINGEHLALPLYCYAVSAKRYVMFNLDENGMPVIRKASAHGLGHLYPPYETRQPLPNLPMPIYASDVLRDKIGVTLWQHDHWYRIIMQALGKVFYAPEIDERLAQPAVIRYGANTPDLLAWFKSYNKNRPYKDRIKPFNFLFSLQAHQFEADEIITGIGTPSSGRKRLKPTKAAAPFDKIIERALEKAFDRNTGESISLKRLKTYSHALAQFHLHPEAKFLNGSYMDRGLTIRRRVQACEIISIGKEANRLEQRTYLGDNPDDQIIYGSKKTASADFIDQLQAGIEAHGIQPICAAAKISDRYVREILKGDKNPAAKTRLRIHQAIARLDMSSGVNQSKADEALAWAQDRRNEIGLRRLALLIGEDHSNLAKVLDGKRTVSEQMQERLLSAYQARYLAAI